MITDKLLGLVMVTLYTHLSTNEQTDGQTLPSALSLCFANAMWSIKTIYAHRVGICEGTTGNRLDYSNSVMIMVGRFIIEK